MSESLIKALLASPVLVGLASGLIPAIVALIGGHHLLQAKDERIKSLQESHSAELNTLKEAHTSELRAKESELAALQWWVPSKIKEQVDGVVQLYELRTGQLKDELTRVQLELEGERVPAHKGNRPETEAYWLPQQLPPTVGAIRQVLIGSGVVRADSILADGLGSLPALERRMREANRLRHKADYGRLGRVLPALLEDLQVAAATFRGSDRESAQRLVVDACHCARPMLKNLGYLDLAWIAVERGRAMAQELGDPLLIAASAWNRAEVYFWPGTIPAAVDLAQRAIDDLDAPRLTESPPQVSLLGMLHLKAALGNAVLGREQQARIHLAEARRMAKLLGGDRNDFGTLFGPTNVVLHQVGLATVLGLPTEAVAVARSLNRASLPRERRVQVNLELARAHAQLRREDRATQLLMEGERLAPDYMHAHPLTRRIVADMIRQSTRAITADLRDLAARVGV